MEKLEVIYSHVGVPNSDVEAFYSGIGAILSDLGVILEKLEVIYSDAGVPNTGIGALNTN